MSRDVLERPAPDTYNPVTPKVHTAGALSLDKQSQDRFAMDKQLLAVPGPNTYAADKLDLLPKPIALDMSK